MSLQFYFGPSGAGKSRKIYEEMTQRAGKDPKRNFLIIVPDQFTMETQKDLVLLNERGGILNIDVLSFGRLGHRILEEVGGREIPVLDDTGKSLVLQKVAAGLREELPVLGSFLHRQGYIHEVKSALSEFLQYGIGPEDVTKLIDYAGKRGALAQKLKDLRTLYKGFMEYIHGNFITTEEKLDVLERSLHKSALLQGSVVVFDGFTGFTPIQIRVMKELMRLCGEVVVVLTLGAGEDPYVQGGEQQLFHLSRKTAADLERAAKEAGTERKQDVFILPENESGRKKSGEAAGRCRAVQNGGYRFKNNPPLDHLENNLFRSRMQPYDREQQEIQIFEAAAPREEVHQAGLKICELVRQEGLAYRDIAVITGDLEEYAPHVEEEFSKMEIPCYIDRTRGIVLNPMTEYIKSALEMYAGDFSYESVFHYLRSGLADFTWEEVDKLENYCLRTGIRGYRSYNSLFTRKTEEMERKERQKKETQEAEDNSASGEENAGEGEKALAELNALRQRMMDQVEMLHMRGKQTAGAYVNGLYDFLVRNQVQQKLAVFQQQFEAAGQLTRAKEYAQIYRLVMELLDQIYALLGEEVISLKEFTEILEAGFGEIQVGTIPQNVDRVLTGDMERTRLKQVKVLFFLGVNDGSIPKAASRGGIISDMDREFLRESKLELAPSPRQQMYIQRFYLYLNMTKPSERLYLSFSRVNNAGKAVRPAYLIDTVKRLYPDIRVQRPQLRSPLEQIATGREGIGYLAEGLREYAEGIMPEDRIPEFFTLYRIYGEDDFRELRGVLTEAAFRRYRDEGLPQTVARALYGVRLENSVTRLETFAACAYRHFLQYGLTLQERREFTFERADLGNMYHEVLKQFGEKLTEKHYTWFDFPESFARGTVRELLECNAAVYGGTVLYSSARNEYAIARMERVLTRTVLTLQRQLRRGSFVPDAFEFSFQHADNMESVNVALSQREKMHLQGRIDRIDIASDEENIYVKVIDYKSGDKKFDLAALYYGLQLQLVVYMNAALEREEMRRPGKCAVPAALLYYHIDDPAVETPVELTPEEINEQIGKQLRMNGVVNSEPYVVGLLDREMGDRSDVIPVERKKDGSFSARSSVLSTRELKTVSDYVSRKIAEIGREILEGRITLNPYEKGKEEACTYCAYKKVCGFDPSMPGCSVNKLEELDREEALKRMEDQ